MYFSLCSLKQISFNQTSKGKQNVNGFSSIASKRRSELSRWLSYEMLSQHFYQKIRYRYRENQFSNSILFSLDKIYNQYG